jgi:HD-GYP domain-containing protein (c-di-GMP phosphodiesterase class II)
VADNYDALASRRPYKRGWPAELAWEFLAKNTGTRIDPDCVAVFQRGRADADAARESLPDEQQPERGQRIA